MVSRGLKSLLGVFGAGEKDLKSQRNSCYLYVINGLVGPREMNRLGLQRISIADTKM